jgi:hypothetical protein
MPVDRTNAPTTSARSHLAALREKKPATKSAQLRALWPEIQMALDAGHSLKAICECLVGDGIAVNEKNLAVYIWRIRKRARQKTAASASATPASAKTAVTSVQTPEQITAPAEDNAKKPRDPLANVRERQAKRPGFDYRPELADPKDLI